MPLPSEPKMAMEQVASVIRPVSATMLFVRPMMCFVWGEHSDLYGRAAVGFVVGLRARRESVLSFAVTCMGDEAIICTGGVLRRRPLQSLLAEPGTSQSFVLEKLR